MIGAYTKVDWCAVAISGETVCSLGQLSTQDKKALDALARKGIINKWRGYWHPVPGTSYGIGPLKTCYGKKP